MTFPKPFLVTAAILIGVAAPLHAAETMTKSEITSALIGKTLSTSRKGMPVRLTYNTDGSVAMKAMIISAKGTWRYNGDGLCMNMTSGPRKGETCVTFTDLGNGRYLNSQGMTLTLKN
ncbi:MAG: hypothetical protein Q9M48_10675 [Rhodobacterales bacterium]|nr:hypothetical protein [Rhodobacterales bacterium]